MSTVQDVLDLAELRSQLNDQTLINPALLVKATSMYERQAFIRAARINPAYFGATGDSATRANFTDPWAITVVPGPIAAVTQLFVSAVVGSPGLVVGDRINLIDIRFPDMEIFPRAYIRGRQLYAYNNELGGSNGNMVTKVKLNYSQLPTAATAVTSNMTIPDEWLDLVVLPVAKLMCLRDRRPEDAQLIDAELTALYGLFSEAVLLFEQGAIRPLPSLPPLAFGSQQGAPSA